VSLQFVPEYDFHRPLGFLAGGWEPRNEFHVAGSVATSVPPSFRHLTMFPDRFQKATEDQEQTNSCTGNALVSLHEYFFKKQKGFWEDFSRLFPYFNGRAYRGWQNQDGGAVIGDVFRAAAEFGICMNPVHQFDSRMVNQRPSQLAYQQAKRYRLVNARRIARESVLEVLSGGGDPEKAKPVVGGFIVHQDRFFGPKVRQTGEILLPSSSSSYAGWHALLIAGYDTDWLEGPNSWGSTWASNSVCGRPGWYRIDKGYLLDPRYSSDFCTGDFVEVPEGVVQ
jgi:hypothetical protein